jgi:hypothetical protein
MAHAAQSKSRRDIRVDRIGPKRCATTSLTHSLSITHSHSLTHATAASCPSPKRSVPRVVNLALGLRQSSEPVASCSEEGQLLAGVDAHAPQ